MNVKKIINSSNEVKLGFAEVDITPQKPAQLCGFIRPDNLSKGVLEPLRAQIALWTSPTHNCCIITIDSIGFTVRIANTLRDLVAQRIGAAIENVMLCFSHTHAAPDAALEPAYVQFLNAQIMTCLEQAIQTLAPVKAVWGTTKGDIGVNRRNSHGVVDDRIGVLKVVDADTDKLRFVLLRLTAHANVLSSDNYLISPDFFGTTRKLLERKYNCNIMITQGASGNIRPKFQHSDAIDMEERPMDVTDYSPETVKRRQAETTAALHLMAKNIYKAVETILDSMYPMPIHRLMMFSKKECFFANVPSPERAKEIADEAMERENIDGSDWLLEVSRLHSKKIQTQKENMEVQYFVLNDGCCCGIASEVMCETALDILQKANQKSIFFGGYTNACDGYLPTGEEYDKGGYEVLWSYLQYFKSFGRVMSFNRDTAERLAESVSKTWNLFN